MTPWEGAQLEEVQNQEASLERAHEPVVGRCTTGRCTTGRGAKSLYELKQAPQVWYNYSTYTLEFTEAKSDTSLFNSLRGSKTVYMLLYVDDIILTATSNALL
jgi:hypothetical protein